MFLNFLIILKRLERNCKIEFRFIFLMQIVLIFRHFMFKYHFLLQNFIIIINYQKLVLILIQLIFYGWHYYFFIIIIIMIKQKETNFHNFHYCLKYVLFLINFTYQLDIFKTSNYLNFSAFYKKLLYNLNPNFTKLRKEFFLNQPKITIIIELFEKYLFIH